MKRRTLTMAVVLGLGMVMGSGVVLADNFDDHTTTFQVHPFEKLTVNNVPTSYTLMPADLGEYGTNVVEQDLTGMTLNYRTNWDNRKITVQGEYLSEGNGGSPWFDLTVKAMPDKNFGVAEGSSTGFVAVLDGSSNDLITGINRVNSDADLTYHVFGTIEDGHEADIWTITYTLTAQ